MAVSGWYPDPDGTPGRFRYWNGSSWSTQTTGDPSAPPPADRLVPAQSRASRWPLWIGALAVVLIIAVVSVLVIRSRQDSALVDRNPPAPTISGWNDSSPFPSTPPPSTPPPSSAPAPSSSGSPTPVGKVACATGDPSEVQPHPNDGRLHGGSLSIAQPGGDWQRDDGYAQGMSWAYDVFRSR